MNASPLNDELPDMDAQESLCPCGADRLAWTPPEIDYVPPRVFWCCMACGRRGALILPRPTMKGPREDIGDDAIVMALDLAVRQRSPRSFTVISVAQDTYRALKERCEREAYERN
jgi:hypothetical protein